MMTEGFELRVPVDLGRRSSVVDRNLLIESIKSSFWESMRNKGFDGREFICMQDITNIWDRHGLWTVLSQPDRPCSSVDVRLVRDQYLKTLSIAVFVDASERFWELLKALRSQPKPKHDRDLPYDPLDVECLGQDEKHRFLGVQDVFNPVCIIETEEKINDPVPAQRRLPFDDVTPIGAGSYGSVIRVVIPATYFKDIEGRFWGKDVVVACKVFHKDETSTGFFRERDSLNILKKSMRSHERILLHMAAFIHGSNYIIILPLAEHGDLNKLLYSESSSNSSSLLNAIRGLNRQDLHRYLLQEMRNICDAVNFLHTSLSDAEHRNGIYAAHFDLKPDNIMIKKSPHSALGLWVVSDFGLSVYQSETGQRDDEFSSIGDTVSRMSRDAFHGSTETLDARTERKIGTYLPPEAETNRQAGRRSDVWSLTCISSVVLAFALGGTEGVKGYEEKRMELRQDDRFYCETNNSTPLTEPQYCVRPAVDRFLHEAVNKAGSQTWIGTWVDAIRQCLVPNHDQRPNSAELKRAHSEALAVIRGQRSTILDASAEFRRYPRGKRAFQGLKGVGSQPCRSQSRSILIESKPWPQHQANGPKKVSVSNCGCYVVWLFTSAMRVDRIASASTLEKVQIIQLDGANWEGVVVAGNLVAAWGYSQAQHRMKIMIESIGKPHQQIHLPDNFISRQLISIGLSERGQVVFLTPEKINLGYVDSGGLFHELRATLCPLREKNHYFSSASFNDVGTRLYAWSSGEGPDLLYIWSTPEKRITGHSIFSYDSRHYNPTEMSLLPYISDIGCIMKTSNRKLFPAQFPCSRSDGIGHAEKHERCLPNLVTACILDDRSIIAVEKQKSPWPHFKLKEYPIEEQHKNGDLLHLIAGVHTESIPMRSNINSSSVLGKIETLETRLLTVCNLNGTIELFDIGKAPW